MVFLLFGDAVGQGEVALLNVRQCPLAVVEVLRLGADSPAGGIGRYQIVELAVGVAVAIGLAGKGLRTSDSRRSYEIKNPWQSLNINFRRDYCRELLHNVLHTTTADIL